MKQIIEAITNVLNTLTTIVIILVLAGLVYLLVINKYIRPERQNTNPSQVHLYIENRSKHENKILVNININNSEIYKGSLIGSQTKSFNIPLKKENNVLSVTFNEYEFKTDTIKAESNWNEYDLNFFIDDRIEKGKIVLNGAYSFYPHRP